MVDGFIGGFIKERAEQRSALELETKVRLIETGAYWLRLNIKFPLLRSSIYFMFEQPVCAFAASRGYGDEIAEVAMSLIYSSISNYQYYFNESEEGVCSAADYHSKINVFSSKLDMLLINSALGLIINRLCADEANQYSKIFLCLSLVEFLHNFLFYYNENQDIDKDLAIKIVKYSLLASTSNILSKVFTQHYNCDNSLLDSILVNAIYNTAHSLGSLAI